MVPTRCSPAMGAGAPAGRVGMRNGRAIGTRRAAGFFFGATRRTAGFFLAAFLPAFFTVFLRSAGFLAGVFFRFTLVFAFFLAAMCTPSRVS